MSVQATGLVLYTRYLRRGPAERPPWCTETKEVKSLSAFQHALGIRSGTTHVPSKAEVKWPCQKRTGQTA